MSAPKFWMKWIGMFGGGHWNFLELRICRAIQYFEHPKILKTKMKNSNLFNSAQLTQLMHKFCACLETKYPSIFFTENSTKIFFVCITLPFPHWMLYPSYPVGDRVNLSNNKQKSLLQNNLTKIVKNPLNLFHTNIFWRRVAI